MTETENDSWLYEISPERRWFDFNLRELWRYRDLLLLFVKRDIVTLYKQTLLGPLWYFVQPLLVSVVFTLVFNNIAGIPTGEVPPFLFHLAGISFWNYFSHCLTKTASTFRTNAPLFEKVYFPRVLVPMSISLSNLLKFGIQLVVLGLFYAYFSWQGFALQPNLNLLLFPVYLLMMAFLALGLGMLISAVTTKYRDLFVVLEFATSLLLYVSAVPYPMAEAAEKLPRLGWLVEYNPMAQVIEGFRYMLFDTGAFSWGGFFYTFGVSLLLFLAGLMVFNRTSRNFVDTV